MTQQEIKESEELDLSFYLGVLLRRRWIVLSAWAVVVLCTLLHVFTAIPIFQAHSLIVIEKERGGATVFANGTMVESNNDDYYQTQYRLLKSNSLVEKVYENLGLDKTDEFSQPNGPQKLNDAITIAPVLRSRLVYLKADSRDPVLASKISNELARTFVEQNLTNQLFISKEVLEALRTERAAGSQRTYDSLPAVVNNSLIQSLKGDHAKLQAQAADMAAKFTPKHPLMVALRSNIAELQAQIQAETDKIVQSLKTELSGKLKGNNVRVIDSAQVPQSPVRPRKVQALGLAILGGFLAGFLAALGIEMIDQSIRTQEDVDQKLGLPFLATIPHIAGGRKDTVYASLLSKEPSLTSEAFRNLRTMVDFAGVAGDSRKLLVTSAVQEEGKSYVSTNLAVAFSQLGERVLLIDGDLRRPKLHKNFHASSARGLSEYLATAMKIEDIGSLIQDTEVAGLHLIPCGTRPPNPSELLNTPKVPALLNWASSNFDRVLIDCTPMFPINDTLLWGRHVSSVVFTVRFGRTRAPLIRTASQKIQNSGMKILGVAINAAKPGGLTYASYGYYYQQDYQAYQQESEPSRAV